MPRPNIMNDAPQREPELQRTCNFYSALLAMAGHDLREPLQVIQGVYSRLARHVSPGPEREYLECGGLAISQLANHLDHLVDALRLNERTGCFEPAPVKLKPLLSALHSDNAELATRKGIELHVLQTDAAVMSDALLLNGILRNFISNALKYTRPGGRILVGCRRRGPSVRIEVHDTGIGIPSDQLLKVFEAFQRLDSTESDGLGLGLFIVRRTADLLRHPIEVRSAVGRGSCFAVLAKSSDATGGYRQESRSELNLAFLPAPISERASDTAA